MNLSAGRRIGRYTLGEALPAPGGFVRVAVEDDAELVVPNTHLRLRAGALTAWEAARTRRRAAPTLALSELAWVDVDGWPGWVRPRTAALPELSALDDTQRGEIAGWLAAGGVDLGGGVWEDLVLDADGLVRWAPLGLRENPLGRAPSLAVLLGLPAAAPAEPPRLAVSLVSPSGASLGGATGLVRTAAAAPTSLAVAGLPAALVIVTLPPGDPRAIARVASRSATRPRDVERAASRPRRWLWGTAAHPASAIRLRLQAERAGLQAEIVAAEAPSPSFLPAVVLAGLAQVPSFASTGVHAWDLAILGGLGLTAVLSMVRALRRVGPARRAAGAVGALEGWRRAERSEGPEQRLFRLEAHVAGITDTAPVRTDLADALNAAWTTRFAILEIEDLRSRTAAERELDAAAAAVEQALADPESRELVEAIARLGVSP